MSARVKFFTDNHENYDAGREVGGITDAITKHLNQLDLDNHLGILGDSWLPRLRVLVERFDRAVGVLDDKVQAFSDQQPNRAPAAQAEGDPETLIGGGGGPHEGVAKGSRTAAAVDQALRDALLNGRARERGVEGESLSAGVQVHGHDASLSSGSEVFPSVGAADEPSAASPSVTGGVAQTGPTGDLSPTEPIGDLR